MTEKRYTIGFDKYAKNSLILENKEFFCRIHHIDKNKIIDRLNKQEELINTLREELELADKENTSLEKENDELKQQLKTKVIVNKQYEELQNLKNQIKIYELFLDQNDLNIEWDLFCTLNHCVNEEDTGCQTCKYMGLVDSDGE